ncbi:MAG: hypothetical protein HY531_01200 [Chloroflexi bacterium]|nr:hypothetical protein [Chloroflexota bacterium]
MKSLKELLVYYQGISRGAFATSEHKFPSGTGRVELGEDRRDIDSAILYDADRLAKAALASFLASSRLLSGGHRTWADITLYYAEFHIVNALLRLAGVVSANKGRSLLLRVDEVRRAYSVLARSDPKAKEVGFSGGGSHKELWRMFARTFRDWTDTEPRQFAYLRRENAEGEGWKIQGYEIPVMMRNQANYLQSIVGVFFPETDLTGLQEATVSTARRMGNWDWLRTDDNPMSEEEPPEAYFHEEMMAWDLIKYVIRALVALEGERLLEQYIWIIENLDAHDELRDHMKADLQSMGVEKRSGV